MFVNSLMKKIAGANYPAVSQSDVRNEEIPLPPLDDQKRIAHMLGKVEGLIAQRKQHLQQLDALLKSVFLEMFGDPVKNEKGWEICSIADVCDQIVDCVNKTAQESETPTPFIMIRTSNIRHGRISLEKIKFVDEATYAVWTRRSVPQRGDILFTREAPMGEAGMVTGNDKIFLGQRIMQYRFNITAMNPIFALHQMQSFFFLRQIERLGKGSTVKHLTVPDCFEFKVFKPVLELQNQFAAVVEKIEGIKGRDQQSLTDLEALYGALSQKAFAGELDLSRITIPHLDEEIPLQAPAPDLQTNPIPKFNLPKIPEGINLADKSQRASQIKMWLDAYIDSLYPGQELSASKFVSMVSNALRLAEGIDPWGQPDQDQIKDLIFDALTSGRLTQTSAAEADKSPLRKIVLHKAGPKIDR